MRDVFSEDRDGDPDVPLQDGELQRSKPRISPEEESLDRPGPVGSFNSWMLFVFGTLRTG